MPARPRAAWRTPSWHSPASGSRKTKRRKKNDRKYASLGAERVRRLHRAAEESLPALLGVGVGLVALQPGQRAQHWLPRGRSIDAWPREGPGRPAPDAALSAGGRAALDLPVAGVLRDLLRHYMGAVGGDDRVHLHGSHKAADSPAGRLGCFIALWDGAHSDHWHRRGPPVQDRFVARQLADGAGNLCRRDAPTARTRHLHLDPAPAVPGEG